MYNIFDIEIKGITTSTQLINKLGLDDNGIIQKAFTNDVMKRSEKFAPFLTGSMIASAGYSSEPDAVVYVGPQVRYLWYGKLMVDPITMKGAFFSPTYGFWSRPNTRKVLDPQGRDLNYTTLFNPLAGPFWVDRMWQAQGQEVIDDMQSLINERINK